jgi:hypothetical protein
VNATPLVGVAVESVPPPVTVAASVPETPASVPVREIVELPSTATAVEGERVRDGVVEVDFPAPGKSEVGKSEVGKSTAGNMDVSCYVADVMGQADGGESDDAVIFPPVSTVIVP